MTEQALSKAIALIRAGQIEPARQILTDVLKVDPNHEQAWLWVSECFEEPERKQYCFERVLKTNPANPAAAKALAALQSAAAQPAAVETPGVRPAAAQQPVSSPPAAQFADLRAAAVQPAAVQQPRPLPVNSQAAAAASSNLVKRLERHKYKGILSFLLSLLIVAMIAGAVLVGLNYLLPDDIPITHSALKTHLTAIGIFCTKVEPTQRVSGYAYVMHCSGNPAKGRLQVSVDIYSEKDPAKIDLILAYATQLKGEPELAEMRDLLAHVAALPYKNANPEQASSWVQQEFPALLGGASDEDSVTQFGRVRFRLASLTADKKYLAIGKGQN